MKILRGIVFTATIGVLASQYNYSDTAIQRCTNCYIYYSRDIIFSPYLGDSWNPIEVFLQRYFPSYPYW